MKGPLACIICKATPEYPTGMVEGKQFTCARCIDKNNTDHRRRRRRFWLKAVLFTALAIFAARAIFVIVKILS